MPSGQVQWFQTVAVLAVRGEAGVGWCPVRLFLEPYTLLQYLGTCIWPCMMLYVRHCLPPWFGDREEVSMLTFFDTHAYGHPALRQAGYIVNTQRTACVPCAQGKFSDTPGAAVPWSRSWAVQVWHGLAGRLQRVYQQSWDQSIGKIGYYIFLYCIFGLVSCLLVSRVMEIGRI